MPHQVDAVYNKMLPLQPLRFLLTDDPGAGKTIMAGLLCKELMVRGDVERCLVIAPGSLVELIARLDHLSRNDNLQAKLRATEWDLVIVDEAYKMSAHYVLGEVRETRRYRLGQLAGSISHLLLMTATSHAGIEEDFRPSPVCWTRTLRRQSAGRAAH